MFETSDKFWQCLINKIFLNKKRIYAKILMNIPFITIYYILFLRTVSCFKILSLGKKLCVRM